MTLAGRSLRHRLPRATEGTLLGAVPEDVRARDDAAARIQRAGVAVAIGLVAVQSIAHIVNAKAFDLSINEINVDSDSSAWAWASAMATAACGVLLALLAAVEKRAVPLLLLAVALLFLSLDDTLAIHERVSEHQTEIAGVEHASRLFWPLVYMPLLVAVFGGLWSLSRRMELWSTRLIRFGLACLAAAIAMEMGSPLLFELGFGHGSAPYELEATAEEGLELGGWLLAATAIAATIVRSGGPGPASSQGADGAGRRGALPRSTRAGPHGAGRDEE